MKNKILYVMIVVATLLGCILSASEIIIFLLAYEIILLPVLWLLTEALKKHVKAELRIPTAHIEKNQEFVVEVLLQNTSVFPMPVIWVRLSCENEFTGEKIYLEERVMTDAKGEASLLLSLKSKYCGKMRITLEEIRVQDYLRLFSKKTPVQEISKEIIVLPKIHKISLNAITWVQDKQEGEEFSHARSGEDTAEVFDVHEYREGDTFQRVHWKLTAKAEEYLVKEYSLPIEQTILVFLDFYAEKEQVTQAQFDCFLEILASLSWSMAEQSLNHMILWYQEAEGQLSQIKIEEEQDVYYMLEQVCDSRRNQKYADVLSMYEHQSGMQKADTYFLLNVQGVLYKDGVCEKKFSQKNLEEELIEWKLEI